MVRRIPAAGTPLATRLRRCPVSTGRLGAISVLDRPATGVESTCGQPEPQSSRSGFAARRARTTGTRGEVTVGPPRAPKQPIRVCSQESPDHRYEVPVLGSFLGEPIWF